MACRKLMRGHDLGCDLPHMKYFQQVVLVNKEDVNQVRYFDGDNNNHGILFNLFPGTEGFLYRGSEIASNYYAEFNKFEKKGRPYYTHTINLPIVGVTQNTKLVLKQLDNGNYFAAIQFTDGTIEIYGFDNGLKTSEYTYNAQNNLGGSLLTLTSKIDEEEIPWVYLGQNPDDFDNKFCCIEQLLCGDFNNDFNNDFSITECDHNGGGGGVATSIYE